MPHTLINEKQIERLIKKSAKKVIAESGLSSSTRTGNKALDHLVKQLVVKQLKQPPIANLSVATKLGEDLGQKIVSRSQQLGKTNLDRGVIRQLLIDNDLPSTDDAADLDIATTTAAPKPQSSVASKSVSPKLSPELPNDEPVAQILDEDSDEDLDEDLDEDPDENATKSDHENDTGELNTVDEIEPIDNETKLAEAEPETVAVSAAIEELEDLDMEAEPEVVASESTPETTVEVADDEQEMEAEAQENEADEELELIEPIDDEPEKAEADEEPEAVIEMATIVDEGENESPTDLTAAEETFDEAEEETGEESFDAATDEIPAVSSEAIDVNSSTEAETEAEDEAEDEAKNEIENEDEADDETIEAITDATTDAKVSQP